MVMGLGPTRKPAIDYTVQAPYSLSLRNWAAPISSLGNWSSGAILGNKRKLTIFILGVRQLLRGITCPPPLPTPYSPKIIVVSLVAREGWNDSNMDYGLS